MTKLLEQAIAQARELSEAEQDGLADALFAHLPGRDGRTRLTAEQVADVARIRDHLRSGRTRLATDEEVDAVWKKCGL
jgi:gamma-glutamyl phosphate reductase